MAKRRRSPVLLVVPLLILGGACADEATSNPDDPSGTKDAGGDGKGGGSDGSTTDDDGSTTDNDGAPPGDSSLPACNAPTGLGRGVAWVRANPMMISGLSVVMGAPSSAAVTDYFDSFHATAVHLWENGLPTEMAGWAAPNHPGFRYISWVHKDGKSVANGQVLGGAPALPGRIGYQIGDEPLDNASWLEIQAGAAVVKNADAAGLRIVNINDSDGAEALRAQIVAAADVDILSYDHYNLGTSANNGLMKIRSSALGAGKPYWRYTKSFHYKNESQSLTAADLRWDALVGVVYGFTGYTWFVYSVAADSQDLAPDLFQVGGNYGATKTALYQAAATTNQELAQIGRSLVLLKSTDVRYVASISLLRPSGIQAWAKGAGSDPYLSGVAIGGGQDALVGFFRDDCGETYVMVQNQAHPDGTFPNNSSNTGSVSLEFDFGGATDATLDKTAVLALDTMAGTVATKTLTPAGGTKAKLDVALAPGEVLFFKYKNGRPFVRQ